MGIVGPTFWGTLKKYQRLSLESMLDILGEPIQPIFLYAYLSKNNNYFPPSVVFVGNVSILKYQ